MGLFDKPWFTIPQKERVEAAIGQAELNTSGEIRVHIESHCPGDVLDCAANWFDKLKMNQTQLRNGVLFYLAFKDKKFAILGDSGINEKVPDDFWNKIKEVMQSHFMQQQFVDGLEKGILMAGEQLKMHFPYQSDDKNELSDEISFGK